MGRIPAALLSMIFMASCDGPASSPGDASSDADGDSDTDADSDSETDTGTDTGTEPDDSWNCPVVVDKYEDCYYGNLPGDYLPSFTADDAGGSVVFATTLGTPSLLLAARTVDEETSPVVFALSLHNSNWDPVLSSEEVGLLDAPTQPLSPRGTVTTKDCASSFYMEEGMPCEPSVLGYLAVALLCASDGACALYGLEGTPEAPVGLAPLTGGDVPMVEPVGSYWLHEQETPGSLYELVCVYGDGIACFDGTSWTTEISSGVHPTIRAVDVSDGSEEPEIPTVVAVGDDGLLLFRYSSGWEVVDSDTDADLVTISWLDSQLAYIRFVAASSDLFVVGSHVHDSLACEVSGGPFVMAVGEHVGVSADDGEDPDYYGFDETILYSEAGRQINPTYLVPCVIDDEPVGRPLVSIAWDSSYERSLVTADGLFTRHNHYLPD